MNNTNYTDTQFKQALAKMLPDDIQLVNFDCSCCKDCPQLRWLAPEDRYVLDTELLHLCWTVEQDLIKTKSLEEQQHYHYTLRGVVAPSWAMSASWQQRTIVLAKVKEIDII